MLVLCMLFGLAACKDSDGGTTPENPDTGITDPDGGTDNPDENGGSQEDGNDTPSAPVQLVAPHISLNEGVITWSAVEHANYYEVYEGETRVARVTATAYTVAQYNEGTYYYSVKAFSASASYTASELSNTVTYTIEAVVQQQILDAPVISLNENTLSWSAVDNADGYNVYEDGELIATTAQTSYKINQYMPATYNYTVRATSTNSQYVISPVSNVVTRTVTAQKMTYTVSVSIPSTLSASEVYIGLFDGNTRVSSQTVTTINSGNGVYKFMLSATLSYEVVARVLYLPAGYTASETTLTPNRRDAQIEIYTVSNGELVLGNNSVRVDTLDDEGADIEYTFVAEKGGAYTVLTEEAAGIIISVNGIMVINASGDFRQSTFSAEAGETVIFTIVCEVINVNFTFTIKEGAQKRYFEIGSGYNDKPNMFIGAGTYYLNVEQAGVYTFFFGATLNNYNVTMKIGGVDYTFGYYGMEVDGDAQLHMKDIELPAGEIEIEITLSDNYWDDLLGFFIWRAQ